jgi:hypothetical protein
VGGGQSGSSSTKATIPKELRPLYSQTGQELQNLQNQAPVSGFTGSNPLKVAPLADTQRMSLGNIQEQLRGGAGPLESSPIVGAGQRYYEANIAPGIENRAALSGLGRSTALTNALASTEATTMLPLFQGEEARRERLGALGLQAGQVERGAEQDVNTAEYQDFLRRQGLSEQALFGPMGQLPSTIGQKTSTSSSGGGMFK